MSAPNPSTPHPVLAVNGGLLGTILYGWGAVALWPQNPLWWGLGVLSVMMGMASAACLANALGAIMGRYRREREVYRYLSQGGGPKSAGLATEADLRRAGMIE